MIQALRIFFYSGYRRQLCVVVALLVGSLIENIGIAALWPIFSLATGNAARANSFASRIVTDLLAFLHLPITFGILLGVIIASTIIKFIFSLIGMNFVGREVANVATGLRLRLIDAIMHARWSYFTGQQSGRFTSAIGLESDRASFAFRQAGLALAKSAECAAYLIGVFIISWQFSLGAILGSVIVWSAVARYLKMSRKAGAGKSKYNRKLSTGINEILTNIKSLKASNRHHHVATVLGGDIFQLRRVLERETYSNAAVIAFQEPLLAVLLIGGIFLGHEVLDLQLQGLVATLWLLRRISGSIGDIRQAMQAVYVDASAFWNTVELIKEIEAEHENLRGGVEVELKHSAQLEHVAFAYPNREVMRDVSMRIPAGKITTIIGPSGAGKTTIADLFVGLNKPAKGRAYIDEINLGEADLAKWRHHIGYIPQDSILFNDTIANNVSLGDPNVSAAQIEKALRLAGAWGFVEKLPEGIGQVVGVRGNLLSGGQKQRLSIARALVGDPSLLILDEATSALDHDTAREICAAVRSLAGRRTVLAITHQALWIEASDRVYEMQNGQVTEVTLQPTVA